MLVKFFHLLSKLPLRALHGGGAALGWLVYLASPAYRRRLDENLALAGHAAHRHDAIAQAGKGMLELPFIWCGAPQRVLSTATVANWEVVQEALDGGRGVILLTPHLGCFEITAQAVARHIPLMVLYRPPRKAALKPLIEEARARDNLELAPANLTGVRMLAKRLKQGMAIGLLPDQVPQQGEGVWADFFGKPAYTMTLPAKLHRMTGAPLLLTYAERLPKGRGFSIRFARFDGTLEGGAEQQARAINAAMESLIARAPGQYLWSYNRYKTPPGARPRDPAAQGGQA